jgi:uncharacterized protein YqgC (DUF456 family)
MNIVPTAFAEVDAAAFGSVLDPIISNIVNPIVGLMFAVAIVVFVYGVFQTVWGAEESREAGKKSMIGGIIGMFIMMSAWGIIYVIANTVAELGK